MALRLNVSFGELYSVVHNLSHITPIGDIGRFMNGIREFHVNIYLEDRAYGGPEEGGWWYNYVTPDEKMCEEMWKGRDETTLAFVNRVNEKHGEMVAWCDEQNKQRRSDIGSVISEGRYVSMIESQEAVSQPEETPHYE